MDRNKVPSDKEMLLYFVNAYPLPQLPHKLRNPKFIWPISPGTEGKPLTTKSIQHSPSWEANRFSASQEITHILWSPKGHYRSHNCPPPVRILSQLEPIHVVPPNLTVISARKSSAWLYKMLSFQFLCTFLIVVCVCVCVCKCVTWNCVSLGVSVFKSPTFRTDSARKIETHAKLLSTSLVPSKSLVSV